MGPAHQLLLLCWRVTPQPIQQVGRLRFHHDSLSVGLREESLSHGMIQEAGEPVEVSLYVQDTGWLGVNAQLAPGKHLEEPLQGANPTWKRDKPVGHVG